MGHDWSDLACTHALLPLPPGTKLLKPLESPNDNALLYANEMLGDLMLPAKTQKGAGGQENQASEQRVGIFSPSL